MDLKRSGSQPSQKALPFLQPEQLKDSLHAYQLAKRGNSLRVMTEAVRWGKRRNEVRRIGR
jgi:hypothetical protein